MANKFFDILLVSTKDRRHRLFLATLSLASWLCLGLAIFLALKMLWSAL